jgi:F0F1-type ATP synthase assembly protein I
LRNQTPSGAELAGLGILLAASFLIPLALGAVLDAALHTGPALLILGLLAGIAAGSMLAWRRFKHYL